MSAQEEGALRKQAQSIAKALNAVSAFTGRPFTMRTQAGRFRIQKAVFLLRCVHYPPAERFEFNIYHMGPYSPDLARAYYLLNDDGIRSSGDATDLSHDTLALMRETMGRPQSFLEGLTTVLDVLAQTSSPAAALAQARAVKPQLDEPTWKEVRTFLSTHLALVSAT